MQGLYYYLEVHRKELTQIRFTYSRGHHGGLDTSWATAKCAIEPCGALSWPFAFCQRFTGPDSCLRLILDTSSPSDYIWQYMDPKSAQATIDFQFFRVL
jgi:hypothetical protein